MLLHFLFMFRRLSLVFSTVSQHLARMKKFLSSIDKDIDRLNSDTDNICLFHHHQEQLSDLEMGGFNTSLF